jgi:hypothetical protein
MPPVEITVPVATPPASTYSAPPACTIVPLACPPLDKN